MKLYLLRHATAVDIAPTDAARALTLRGEEEANRAGLALVKLGAKLTHIGCSPLLRARQTAELAAQAMKFAGPISSLEELVNGTPTNMLLEAVQKMPVAQEVLLVGHMPSLAGHLSELVFSLPTSKCGFTPAGCACVEMKKLDVNGGRVLWFKTHAELAKTS